MDTSGNLVDRFWSKVDKTCDCWIWTGGRTTAGYGYFKINNSMIYAHRFAWQITFGEIPSGLLVCHKCDNPPCVNPNHLFVGTVSDNAQDMTRKGRQVFQKHPEKIARGERHGSHTHPEKILRGDQSWSRNHPERLARGEKNGAAKLTEDQVREIRQKRQNGRTLLSLVSEYKVTLNAIYSIVNEITWRHVK